MFDMTTTKSIDMMFPTTANGLVLNKEAGVLYRKAQFQAKLHSLVAVLKGCSSRLLELGAVQMAESRHSRSYQGVQTVEIKKICGSEGRCRDFDREFRPLNGRTQQRWMRIAVAWMKGETLPPVELVQIGECFFVRDGHHRISVATTLGQTYIDAVVLRG